MCHYRKPYKFIEENSEFQLLSLLSKNIKTVKDGVLFDMEIENLNKNNEKEKYLNKNQNLTEKEVDITEQISNITFGNLTKERISEILSKHDNTKNIFYLNQNDNKMEDQKLKVVLLNFRQIIF